MLLYTIKFYEKLNLAHCSNIAEPGHHIVTLRGFDVAVVWLCSVLADESNIVRRLQEEEKTTYKYTRQGKHYKYTKGKKQKYALKSKSPCSAHCTVLN